MLTLQMLTPIAVTEKAEVTTGWGRGGERQPFITFGYQPKASGKDTAMGRRPDLKAYAWQPGAGRSLIVAYVGAMLA